MMDTAVKYNIPKKFWALTLSRLEIIRNSHHICECHVANQQVGACPEVLVSEYEMWEWECRYLRFWNLLWQLKISLVSPFKLRVLIYCCGYSYSTFGGKWIFQREFPKSRSHRDTNFQTRGVLPYSDAVPPSNNQYQLSTTRYHLWTPYTDLLPLITNTTTFTDPTPPSTNVFLFGKVQNFF